jgi:hypothetical protein
VAVSLGKAATAAPAATGFGLSAFGLEVSSDFPLPGAAPGGDPAAADLALWLVPQDELVPLMREARVLRLLHAFDGCAYAMLEGPQGDHLLLYGHRGAMHLSADRTVLRCAPSTVDDPHWQRVLLDTVLWTVSLLTGFELLHASAVDTAAGVVAFSAVSGGGKSSLAAEYLRRGAAFFSDDIVALDDSGDRVSAHPGPAVMNVPGRVDPAEVGGTVIAEIGDERWVEVAAPALGSRPLAAIVLVDRAPGHEAACTRIDGTTLDLLPHGLGLPHLEGRDRRRFEVFGRVAAETPLLHLTANLDVPPAALADLVDAAL